MSPTVSSGPTPTCCCWAAAPRSRGRPRRSVARRAAAAALDNNERRKESNINMCEGKRVQLVRRKKKDSHEMCVVTVVLQHSPRSGQQRCSAATVRCPAAASAHRTSSRMARSGRPSARPRRQACGLALKYMRGSKSNCQQDSHKMSWSYKNKRTVSLKPDFRAEVEKRIGVIQHD